MEINTIDASVVAKMFLAGARNLDAKKEWINELNVFPVPDGDTGTNMSMTMMSAAKDVAAMESPDMAGIARAVSSGSLRGARGNSGVILSQLFRGFTKVITHYETLDVAILSEAATKAVETAYKAVMKPKEGTILTVARGAAEKAAELALETDNIVYFLDEVLKEAKLVLDKTPDMLPVLKDAGVVDSGGQGLVEVLSGAFAVLTGEETDGTSGAYSGGMAETAAGAGADGAAETAAASGAYSDGAAETAAASGAYSDGAAESAAASGAYSGGMAKITAETEAEIRFGYCTEFLIVLNNPISSKEEDELKDYLESVGDSIVVVADDEIIKIHVHTNNPGDVLQRALTLGYLSKIKIDNMREEHQEKLIKQAEKLAKEQAEERQKEKAAKGADIHPQEDGEKSTASQAQEDGQPSVRTADGGPGTGSDEKPGGQADGKPWNQAGMAPGTGSDEKPDTGLDKKSGGQADGKPWNQAGMAPDTGSDEKSGGQADGKLWNQAGMAPDIGSDGKPETGSDGSPANTELKKYGFISVSIGEGINEILRTLGVDYIIEGGQTMNPSTDDILQAIEHVDASTIFILPNNSNIILAANQAVHLCKEKEVIVIPTTNIPQGIIALVNYIPDQTAQENMDRMMEEIQYVKTGMVTYAVRDSSIDGFEIKDHDFMGIGDSRILSVGQELGKTTLDMVEEMTDEESALITVYYGAEIEAATAEALGKALEERYPECEIEVHFGGQPIYYYLISVE